MNGAEALLRTAAGAGISVCFANPGTTEMPFVAALDADHKIRPVLGLFEGVCTGAADGYARMLDTPALVLLHLGPGFANGLANQHNARRARSPMLVVVGDHASWHLAADPPLTSDIESLARPMSTWVGRATEGNVGAITATAIAAARRERGVATLLVCHDHQLSEDSAAPVAAAASVSDLHPDTLAAARRALGAGGGTAILLGGRALSADGLAAAGRIQAATGCALFCETFPARIERGPHLPTPSRLPYLPAFARAVLAPFQHILLAGARAPVAFFGYPGDHSALSADGCELVPVAEPAEDTASALQQMADALQAPPWRAPGATRPEMPGEGSLSAETATAVIAAMQPEGAIVIDEGATSTATYFDQSVGSPAHSVLTLTGGAIGQGMPCATGAAIACPDRRVLSLQADGSGMYTLQALWTQARERLDVTTVVFSNRAYRILGLELANAGVLEPGENARRLIELDQPRLDWVALARGQGVPGVRAETTQDLRSALEEGLRQRGPFLIEAVI